VLVIRRQPSGSKPGTDWEARFNCNRQPEVKVLDKAFAGIPAGARMLVVTPSVVDAAVAEIPFGAVVEAAILRRSLAASHDAEYMCPVTTGIALRVVAERAVSAHAGGCGLSHAVLARNRFTHVRRIERVDIEY
jgi:hypothetical protein